MSSAKFTFFWVFALCMTVTSQAEAYILPPDYLFKLLARHYFKYNTLKVEQKTIIYGDRFPDGSIQLEGTLFLKTPDLWRVETTSAQGSVVYVGKGKNSLTILNDRITSDKQDPIHLFPIFFLLHSSSLLMKEMSALGININEVRYGHFDGQVGYVLGDNLDHPIPPQLWLHLQHFSPLRWIGIQEKEGQSTTFEVRYLDYRELEQRHVFPWRVQFYRNGILSYEYRAENVILNPPLSDSIFDLNTLRKSLPFSPLVENKTEDPDLNSIEQLMKEFKEQYP